MTLDIAGIIFVALDVLQVGPKGQFYRMQSLYKYFCYHCVYPRVLVLLAVYYIGKMVIYKCKRPSLKTCFVHGLQLQWCGYTKNAVTKLL